MIKRNKYLEKITKELSDLDTILFLVGARQVGKTTLLKSLIDFEYIDQDDIFWIDGDKIYEHNWKHGDDLLTYIRTFKDISQLKYIIIDEAQYIKNIGMILKNLIDDVRAGKLSFKLIVSGSGTLNVFKGITDTLTGRKKIFQIYPFDFEEFCCAKGIQDTKIQQVNLEIFQNLFEEYALYGGYPKVVTTKDPIAKKEILVQLFNDYLFKDIALLLSEKDIINLKQSFKTIATFTTSLVKISSLAQQIGISRYTLEKYFFVLENTFLFSVINGFVGGGVGGEIKKMTKFYFQDIGFLRFLLGVENWFGTNKGQMVETFVANQILVNKSSIQQLYFWHTKSNSEVDFVLQDEFTGKLIPIEVKSYNNDKIPKSFDSFCTYYDQKIDKGIILTESMRDQKITSNNKKIDIAPYLAIRDMI